MYSYFSAAKEVPGHISGALSHLGPLTSFGMKTVGLGMGAYDAYSGMKEIYDNSGQGGTWSGMASGALKAAGGIGQVAMSLGTGGMYGAAAVTAAGIASAYQSYNSPRPTTPGQRRYRNMSTVSSGVQAMAGAMDVATGGRYSALSNVANAAKTTASLSSKAEMAGRVSQRAAIAFNV